ncbi:MAG TPA: [protein-PII] uridylyltransferase [Terriglobia bacterium]|nr:[protein-PII] uridylyltransferase [Terriglobia bacterium]
MSTTSTATSLANHYAAESARIRERFEITGDGRAVALDRTALIDAALIQLYDDHGAPGSAGGGEDCLVALGGYGRRELFPHSDIDLLFLAPDEAAGDARRESVAALTRSLWDLGLRVGSSARALAECGELHRDNLEFSVSLLDCRWVAGDQKLFARLRHEVIPRLVAREHQNLVRDLVEMTRRRHEKYGHTIFHLEPNIKEAPGGLRDYQVSRWLETIRHLKQQARWEDPEELWPPSSRADGRAAFDYLAATRTFLHFHQGRDDNHLTYELQDEAAALGIGGRPGGSLPAAEWMRLYFRHARSIDRRCDQLLDDAIPVRTSLSALFRDWRSRQSTPDFRVERGRIFPRRLATGAVDPVALLEIFELMACHAVDLSREAERWVEEALPRVAGSLAEWPGLWQEFRPVLVGPHSAFALRAMHRLGVLDVLFPEFRAIDSLVVRDFYHRYTVDEHSLMTIQNLNRLMDGNPGEGRPPAPGSGAVWDVKFSEILSELEQPELLFLSLLFHDVGKGTLPGDHVKGSLDAIARVFERLSLELEDRETVAFLISSHLEMSATMQRRDIFDPDTVRTLADKVGAPERLKMLCLLTYADIKSVNPEALTPWKAEKLWQLYAGTSNYLARSLDEERVHAAGQLAQAERVLQLLPQSTSPQLLSAFLEGFPTRYLRTHTAEEIAAHFQMSRRLAENPVQLSLRNRGHSFELTVLIHDRPFLFASLTGTLAAWGMNIIKADAFANALGTVLDTFRFVDLHRTLELNPSESRRFEQSVVDVLTGRESLQTLMSGRINPQKLPQAKVEIRTQVRFEDSPPGSPGSARTSLLELITQDRPGLLYQVSSTIAELGFNIEVALIDTEGQKVIDVFYLTSLGAKLDSAEQQRVREGLLNQL